MMRLPIAAGPFADAAFLLDSLTKVNVNLKS